MAVNVGLPSIPIKFKGNVTIDPFGAFVFDERIKKTDIVLWGYVDNGLGNVYAPYSMGVILEVGQIYFYPDAVLYDPGENTVKIAYIVFDGERISD